MESPLSDAEVNPRLKSQLVTFERLTLAKDAFENVAAICKYITSSPPLEKRIYNALICGMVTTYARPFLEADGIGRLPEAEYSKFPDEPKFAAHFTKLHRDMREGRNAEFAHRSPKQSATLLPAQDQADFHKIGIKLHADGSFTTSTNFLDWNVDSLRLVEGLAIYQSIRAKNELMGLMRHWRSQKDYPPGNYILGETLPAST